MEWLCKWHRYDQQEKGQLQKDRELLMGDVLKIQYSIGRGIRYKGGEYQVENIWEGIRLAKHTASQGLIISPKAKEDMDKVKSRTLIKTSAIKAELQSTIVLVKKMDQGQRWPIESLKS